MPYLSLTSWSLHRSLGPLRMTQWDEGAQTHIMEEVPQPDLIQLLDLPRLAKARGIQALDICHFHFPSTSSEYLASLRQAFVDHGVEFYTLLVDYGDISTANAVRHQADIGFIERWIDIASQVGAKTVRVVAGEAHPADRDGLQRAAVSLQQLSKHAKNRGVTVVTENFRSLTSTAANCVYLHDACGGELGFVCDFGNFKGSDKYDAIAALLPFAVSVHGKAQYDDHGMPDEAEYRRCLDLVREAGFAGPITLVYDAPGDEWEGIARIQRIVEDYL